MIWIAALLVALPVSLSIPAETSSAASTSAEPSRTPSGLGYGCQAMCCEGKNNTCHSTGLRINGRGSVTSKCFCDEGCPDMGDCCFDYHTACTGRCTAFVNTFSG